MRGGLRKHNTRLPAINLTSEGLTVSITFRISAPHVGAAVGGAVVGAVVSAVVGAAVGAAEMPEGDAVGGAIGDPGGVDITISVKIRAFSIEPYTDSSSGYVGCGIM